MVKVKTKTGNHTLVEDTEKWTEKFRLWKKPTKDGKSSNRRLPGVLTPGKGPIGKGKGAKPLNKGKSNAAKPTTSMTKMSTSPSTNLKDKAKDCLVVTVPMLQDLAGELQAIEQESLDDGHNSEATQESDLEEEDNEGSMTEVKDQ